MPESIVKKSRRKTVKILKDADMNVKFPRSDYEEIQKIADQIGGMSLSGMIRTLVYAQLEKVKKSGNPRDFLDVLGQKK